MPARKPATTRASKPNARKVSYASIGQWSPFDKCLECEWEGDKGDTYTIVPSRSGTWLCTRLGADGTSKQFTLALDKAAGTIWWGTTGSYYSDVLGEPIEGQLSWFRPHASRPSFVWWAKKQPKTQEDSKSTRSLNWRPNESQVDTSRMACGVREWELTLMHLTVVPDAQVAVAAPPSTQKLPTRRWLEKKSDKQNDDKVTQAAAEGKLAERASATAGQAEEGAEKEDLPVVIHPTDVSREADSAVCQLLEAIKKEFENKEQARNMEVHMAHPTSNHHTSAAFASPPPLSGAPEASSLCTPISRPPATTSCAITSPPEAKALSTPFPGSLSCGVTFPPGLFSTSSPRCVTPPPGLEAAASLEWRAAAPPPPGLPMPQNLLPTCGANPGKTDDETWIGSDRSSREADDLDYIVDPVDLEQPVLPYRACRYHQAHAARTRVSPLAMPRQVAQSKPQQPSERQDAPSDTYEFLVTLDKTGSTKLGVDLDYADGHTLHIDALSADGLVQRWNASNPSLCIKPTDRIVQANGVRGNVRDVIAELKRDKVLKLVISRAKALAQGSPAQEKGKGNATERLIKMAVDADEGDRLKARQQQQSAVGPAATPTAAEAAKLVLLAAHTRTGSGDRALRADSQPGRFQGRWHDICGEVGYIKGDVLIWAHPVAGMTRTKVEHDGYRVRLIFLGQTLSGVLRGNHIHWSESDVWWRHTSAA